MSATAMRPPRARALLPLLVLTAAGCGEPVDPETTGGQLLPGTEGVDYLGKRPFSLSPDGRWMLFSTRPASESLGGSDDLGGITLEKLETYVLYDLRRLEGTAVEVGRAVRDSISEDRSVLFDGGCWLPGHAGWRVGLQDTFGRILAVDPDADAPAWEPTDLDRKAFRERCPFEDPLTGDAVTVGPFHIEGMRSSRVTIRDARDAGLVYAVHRTRFPLRTVLVDEARLSPDGRRLAYTVSPAFGSFIGSARMFLISAEAPAAEPAPLASSVYALRWNGDGQTVYAHVRFGGRDAIHRWNVGG